MLMGNEQRKEKLMNGLPLEEKIYTLFDKNPKEKIKFFKHVTPPHKEKILHIYVISASIILEKFLDFHHLLPC